MEAWIGIPLLHLQISQFALAVRGQIIKSSSKFLHDIQVIIQQWIIASMRDTQFGSPIFKQTKNKRHPGAIYMKFL